MLTPQCFSPWLVWKLEHVSELLMLGEYCFVGVMGWYLNNWFLIDALKTAWVAISLLSCQILWLLVPLCFLNETLTEMLHIPPINSSKISLPSPEELKGKILIKVMWNYISIIICWQIKDLFLIFAQDQKWFKMENKDSPN